MNEVSAWQESGAQSFFETEAKAARAAEEAPRPLGVPFRNGTVRAFEASEVADILATARAALRKAAKEGRDDEARAAATTVIALCLSDQALRAQLGDARRDTERLDAIIADVESFGGTVGLCFAMRKQWWLVRELEADQLIMGRGLTAREALDDFRRSLVSPEPGTNGTES
jgi:uncharacterized protein with GYD domain